NVSEEKADHKLSLEGTRQNKRFWSWLLFAVILVAFLVIPLLSLFNDDAAAVLRNSPLPSDNSWTSGELSPAHQIPDLNQNCDACHVDAFVMVQDETCLACHSDTSHHFDTMVHDVSKLEGERCASCHREHNEPPEIVHQDDRMCTTCHADMAASGAVTTELRDVDSFGQEQSRGSGSAPHPAIRVSMLVPSGEADATTWEMLRFDLAQQPEEKSNLIFPHDVHLDPAGIESPEGETVLGCSDCHVTDDAGKLMLPISMEQNCRSCHTLVFDPAAPDREVPHGDPDTVLLTLEEYYSRQYLLNSLGRQPTVQEVKTFMLRRPGQNVQRRVEQKADLASPWGKARSVAQEIFERTTCKTCHEVSVDESGTHLSPWRVNPIRITEQWMPKTDFDHYSHRLSDCEVCHSASTSTESSDVLMPDLPVCEACHTGARTHEVKLPSNCISCHQFHLPDQRPWGDSVQLDTQQAAATN
ncbi:MAG: hypothetical protein KJP04_05715, partial [Arenicella sp.]|nr:hypothetical protein [Arenicella sp.]